MTRTFTIRRAGGSPIHLDLDGALNEAQRAAATCGNGPKLVIAGAGSGKTRTITYRVACLMTRGVAPSQILLATFTNKAAREMLSRVEALTGGDARGIWGGTFHAIGNRLLRRFASVVGLRSNYSILDEQDQRDLIKLCVADMKIKLEEKRFPSPMVIQDLVSLAFNTQRSMEHVVNERAPHFISWVSELHQIAGRYETKKRSANALDYDDLLSFWLKLLKENPQYAERLGGQFRHVLVDEYQDTNIVQAQIVECIAEHNGRNLMVVGDDAQSIYRFRGAHYDNILRFPERNPGTEIFKLEVNYRSTPEILRFTNASIAQNQAQYEKTLTAHRPSGAHPIVLPANDAYQEAAFVAEQILQLRDENIPLEDMAVLYRSHAHSTILQAELIKRDIPYEVRSGMRFFEMAHIKDVVAYLKILDNPFDEVAWRRLLLMLPRVGNATAGRIWQAISCTRSPLVAAVKSTFCDGLPSASRAYVKRFQHDLRLLQAAKKEEHNPTELLEAVMATNYPDYLRATYESYQSRLEDIRQLEVFARSYRTLRSFLSELVMMGELYAREVNSGASGDTERLILSSVHQAKGLEWRVVFIIRMSEGDFPSPIALREEGAEQEERRIFYVATTRAQDELYITHPLMDVSMRGDGGVLMQPSRFLRELGFNLYEQGQIDEMRCYAAETD